jgi:hypothetical protein
MPRTIVYASKRYGGLGILDLYSEQGLCQAQLMITHLRSESYLYNTILILLESFQITAGILGSPVANLVPTPYVDAPWIQSLRTFLQQINGQIHIPHLSVLKKLRKYDRAIMETALQENLSKSELESINACRLFLQVTTFAEITNDRGDQLLSQVTSKDLPNYKTPKLRDISQSRLKWPPQHLPPVKAWRIWRRFLKSQVTSQYKLRCPLGTWFTNYDEHRKWMSVSDGINLIQRTQDSNVLYQKVYTPSRHTLTFQFVRITTKDFETPVLPITPTSVTESTIKSATQEFHLHDPTHKTRQQQYQIYMTKHSEFTDDPIDLTYTLRVHDHDVEIIGFVAQQTITRSILCLMLKYKNDQPNRGAIHAWACLLLLSYVQHQSITQQPTLYVNSIRTTKQLKQIMNLTANPSNCFIPEWEVFQLAAHLIRETKTTMASPTKDKTEELNNLIEDTLLEIDLYSKSSTKAYIPRFRCPTLLVNHHQDKKWIHSDDPTGNYGPPSARVPPEQIQLDNKTFNNIHWSAHEKALTSFNWRFIHGWTPANASYSKTSIGTARLCPYCNSCDETQQHWLQCPHDELKQHWKTAADNVYRKLLVYNKNINAKLVKLLTLAITEWRTTKVPARPDFVTSELYALFDKQSLIGWDQIIQGRFSQLWQFTGTVNNTTSIAYVI